MLCWKHKVCPSDHETPLTDSTVVGPLPAKDHLNDLIIVNQEALDKEPTKNVDDDDIDESQRLTPVIRVWEGDFEVVENKDVQDPQAPHNSHNAWDGEFDKEAEEPPTPTLIDKATSMAHELVNLMTPNNNENEDSDIELDEVFGQQNKQNKQKGGDQQNLLKPQRRSSDEIELSSISSLEDDDNKPSFESSHLEFVESLGYSDEITLRNTNDVKNITPNTYSREDSTPVIIEGDQYGMKNPSFSEEPETARPSSTRDGSKLSTNSDGSRDKEEVFELKELKVEDIPRTISEPHEETGLLSVNTGPSNRGSYSDLENNMSDNGDDNGDVDIDDNASEGSEFLGSLGIYVPEGTWESDLRVELDLQLGREEWQTSLLDIEGEATLDGWGTHLAEFAESKAGPNDWSSKLPEISDSMSVKSDWSSSLTESLLKKDRPEDWNSRFNKIEKLADDRTQWKSLITRIKERVYDKGEWKFTFNKIANRKRSNDNDWNFKLTNSFQSQNSKNKDWNCRFNKLGDVTLSDDDWRLRSNEMDVRSDDRTTHWNTKFLKIQEKNETPETWQTRFRKIEPIPEDKTWDTKIAEMSDDLGGAEDWDIKFIDIESNADQPNNWDVTMNDVPNSKTHPADWNITFQQLEEHLKNPKEAWNFKYNDILENSDDRALWHTILNQLDHGENDLWKMKFNQIEENVDRELDWDIQINTVEGTAEEGEE